MDSHLNGVVICIAGKLIHDANNGQWNEENIKRWIEARSGKLVDVMSDSVTHLLCSIAAYKAKNDKVKYARRIKCNIVTYEWLEDAILIYDQCKRKAPTGLYHPGLPRPEEKILALYRKKSPKAINKEEQAVPKVSSPSRKKGDGNTTEKENKDPVVLEKTNLSNAAENGRKHDERPTESKHQSLVQQKPKAPKYGIRQVADIPHPEINLKFYQIYRDPTDGFPFQVEVSCPDQHGIPRGKRWVLQLFESKATPKLYRFGPVYFEWEGARHRKGRGSGADRPKDSAMKEFEDFFFRKTGIKWEERLLKASEKHKGYVFRYHPPAPGEPVGYIHSKYMPRKAEKTTIRGQHGSTTPACDIREPVSALKRKRDDTAESQLVKAARVTHKMTVAFHDMRAPRDARP